MVQPPATTSSAAVTAAPDALLATKLHIPRTRPGFVVRPRLADRLAQAQGGELALVCAPAGFGKTALLADWVRRSQRPVAWLSLDTGDNDPVRFWRHVAAALDRVRAGVGERVAGLLRPPPRSFDAVVTALVNKLAAQPTEVALVLDDYHLIDAPPVHQSVEFLLEHLPPSLCLVLAGRADPPLPLARLRGRGQLAELRAGDLRFSPEEAAELLRSAVGPDLPEAAVAALADRTEGWVAGLQLAALSLQGRTDITAFVAGFSGSHRYVLDYLTEEVLDRQPEPLRGFLLETSMLERVCGPLCQAVTGRGDSQQLLEQVERANLFLVPLDEVRGWWRYHQLFADLLRARLAREQPERLPALHRAAAAWSEEHGLVDDAVRHALAVDDHESVLRVAEQHITAAMARSEGATLTRWLAALPIDVVRSRPRLCLLQAYRAVGDGQPGPLQRWLGDAERAVAAVGGDAATAALSEPAPAGWAAGWLTNVPGSLAVLRAELARLRGEPHRTIELARQALAGLPERRHILRSLAAWNLARGYWLAGELAEAERALDAIVAERLEVGEHYLALIACWDLGRVQAAQGRLRAAAATYRRALGPGAEADPTAHPALGIAHVGLAEVLCEQDELKAALDQVTEGVQRCRQLANSLPLSAGLATLARIRQAQGDRPGAMAAITEAGEVGPSPEVVDLFNPLPVQRARLLLADGEVDQPARWVATRGLDAEEEPSYVHERELLVLARVLLAQQRPEQARRLLARMGGAAQAQGRTGSLIEVRALEALALDMAGEPAWALAALTQALSLARPEGYVRVFADEGPTMAALLRRLVAAGRQGAPAAAGQVPLDYLGRLLRAVEQQHKHALPASRQATMPGLVEALTARELEVLALLAAGKPNQQIAEELVVTLDTVKKHITHILDKLGATNRMQAVAHARKLGMLP